MQCPNCGIYLTPFQSCPRCTPDQLQVYNSMAEFRKEISMFSESLNASRCAPTVSSIHSSKHIDLIPTLINIGAFTSR